MALKWAEKICINRRDFDKQKKSCQEVVLAAGGLFFTFRLWGNYAVRFAILP